MDPDRRPFRELFKLAHSERRGLLVFLLLAWAVTYLREVKEFMEEDEVSQKVGLQIPVKEEVPEPEKDKKAIRHFTFDPNREGEEDLLKNGLPLHLAQRIVKYRKAGGRFRTSADLQKIYGFPDSLYRELMPYIRIAVEKEEYKPPDRRIKKREFIVLEINTADSSDLTRLKGIGPVYASRIVKYRNSLGGFYKVEQLREIYGMKDSLYESLLPHLSCETDSVRKSIFINSSDARTLASHPYLRNPSLCRSIEAYRKVHGPYLLADDLKSLHLMDSLTLSRIEPYLSFKTEMVSKE